MRVESITRVAAYSAVLLAGAIGCGCGRSTPGGSEHKTARTAVDPVPQRREADDTARFLAGMPGKPGSPFADLEASPAWKEHRLLMDKAWKAAGDSLIPGLEEFQKQELSAGPLADAAVFYPFGGPDALTPLLCFPHSASYVMVALEPPGTLPSLKRIEKKNLAQYLPALRKTMASVLGKSFFVTRDMDRQFRGQVTDGLLVPILQILVRTGHSVNGIRYVTLNESGEFVERPAEWTAPGKHGNKGVEISFRTDADGSVHHLRYLSVNLDDEHLADNDALRKYAGKLKGSVTMFKATSYMVHDDDFSMIRQIALSDSAAILQDDSGLPYRLFGAGGWKVQLYGEYTRPYGSFRFREQQDLRKAYQSAGVKPLPMRIGYGYGKAASNLLLARRTGG
jgi:hypothetical protein